MGESMDMQRLVAPLSEVEKARLTKALASGVAVLWRIELGKGHGFVVMSEDIDALFLWHIGGKGLMPYKKRLVRWVTNHAKKRGLSKVRMLTTRAGARIFESEGFYEEAVQLVKEIHHG